MANIHIKLQQTVGQENNVPAQLVTKLYNLWGRYQNGLDSWDCNENSIKGTFKTGYTYDKYVEALHSFFDNLTIIPEGYYIYFEDPLVESILLTQLIQPTYPDKNYEGVIASVQLLSSGNASQQGFKKIFRDNREIQTFDELPKFENAKALAEEEFRDCQALRSIDLTNIEVLNAGALRSCVSLEYFNGQTSTKGDLRLPNLRALGFNGNYQFYNYKDGSVYKGPQIKRILDLGNCTKITSNCFENCMTLEYIDDSIFEKLNLIDSYAFNNCTNLIIEDLKLPYIQYIYNGAFRYTQVKKISELGTCALGNSSFSECTALTTITDEALSNITSIDSYCFDNCTSLVIEDLKLPKLTNIKDHAFRKTKVKKISDLGNVSTVTGFDGCTLLTSVEIPVSATALGGDAFNGCTSLQSINISNIKLFWSGCLANISILPNIMYLPLVTASIGYKAFQNTNIRSLYLPNMSNTNDCSGKDVPACSANPHRGGSNVIKCGSNMSIIYFKNISKIDSDTFGGRNFAEYQTLPFDLSRVRNSRDTEYPYHNIENGNAIWEYSGDMQIPFGPKGTNVDGYAGWAVYSNVKYLVINRINPPVFWHSFTTYSNYCYGCVGLYGKEDNGQNESFRYLVVPRSSINTYLNWNAFHPDFSSPNVSEEDRIRYKGYTDFNNDDPSNPRIIALESMGHFATKAEYDAAPDMPDGVHSKEEYLIEEYMGLGNETINWDVNPTWGL